jgi:hypothetical protein
MKGNVMKHPLALALTLTSTLAVAQAPTTDASSAPGTFGASGTTTTAPTGSSTVLPSDRTSPGTATMGAPSSDASMMSSTPRRKSMRGSGRATQDDSWMTLYPGKQ